MVGKEVLLVYAALPPLRRRLNELTEVLDPAERTRADRFLTDGSRDRYILGHGLLREVLGRTLGCAPHEVTMERGRHGKPHLPGNEAYFNFSDTKDAVLIGLSPDQEIGVDIETLHRRVDHDAVAGHYFTEPEVAWIRASGPAAKARFLDLWTRKEAILKASGVGIMDDLHSLRVDRPRNAFMIGHAEFIAMAAPEYHVRTMHVGPDHFLSVATERAVEHMHLVEVV
ncbi:MAG: 4'-phosphopantetheinyl transferase superfamily protein [Flavobacteriales bacterium]|nr:4'-phosphopantetheinyl transferase superfamily protein [Flavobacteriales bacterium]MCB9166156.1 4'-phosphopantetheinyl transferase superfamily protein [Flavobacteriales bacterium]